jgi:hypothetical protein
MKPKELLQNNPETNKLLKKWFFDKLTESFENFDKDEAFKDYMLTKGVSDEHLCSVLENNPRACFDLLDECHIIITVDYTEDGWISNYYPEKDDKIYETRLDCEKAALEIGIVELEELLINKTN